MKDMVEFEFSIDALTPETLSMARLADYLKALAALMGNKEAVHFEGVREGSAVLAQNIEVQAIPKIQERLQLIHNRQSDVHKHYDKLNELLRNDNATGCFREKSGTNIIEFPGKNIQKPRVIHAMRQMGNLTGQLIMLGGKTESVPVHLLDGDREYKCRASRKLAAQLAPYLFQQNIRVFGEGEWNREETGDWVLYRFHINRFAPLDNAPLSDVVTRLQAVQGATWSKNPSEDLSTIRYGHKENK